MSEPPYEVRTTWKNHLGNQSIDPLRIYTPRSIDDVVAIVRAAEEAGVTTRAVGSGHSWSDVALTDGFLMKTSGLARAPAAELDFLTPAWEGRTVVRTEAGIRIKELNAYLDRAGLALRQMGGYDHQTVAGVISTSTHGSGTEFGPLNDFAHSLDIVVSERRVVRVERAHGPTNRAAFEAHHGDRRTLIQDDARLRRRQRRDGLHGHRLHGAARGRAEVLAARGARAAPVGEGQGRPARRRRARRQRALRARVQPLRAQARVPVPRDDAQPHPGPAQRPATGACATRSSSSRRASPGHSER